jgi:tetratricopeptide (TPR) repeat protein
LPAIGRAQILVTTTDQSFMEFGHQVIVTEFSRPESLEYLAARTGLSDLAGAEAVAEELGDLPLALAQAAATIRRQNLTYVKYLGRLRRIPLEDLMNQLPSGEYPRSTAAALMMSIQATEDNHQTGLTSQILRVLAALSPHGVGREILDGLTVNGSSASEEDIDAAIERCTTGSLLTWSVNGDSVIMHRLLGRVLRERDKSAGRWAETVGAALDLLELRLIPPEQAWSRRTEGERLATQIDALWEADLGIGDSAPPLRMRILKARSWVVRQLLSAADYSGAIARGRPTLSECEGILGAAHPETLSLSIDLADAYRWAERPDEAIMLSEQTVALCQEALGDDHALTLKARNELAGAYRTARRLDEAVALYRRTLADQERVLGADHPDTLLSCSNLGFACRLAGQLDEATALYERALADRQRVLGANHPDTLMSRSNLGFAYGVAGRLDEAIALHERTLAERERVLGADHPKTLLSQHNLAGAYQRAGRLDEAIALYERTLAERKRVLVPDHPQILLTQNTLAGACQAAGRLDEAIALYERTLADRERVLAADHQQTRVTRNSLAGAYQAAGRLDEAIALYQRTLADRERILGADHPATITTRNSLESAKALRSH